SMLSRLAPSARTARNSFWVLPTEAVKLLQMASQDSAGMAAGRTVSLIEAQSIGAFVGATRRSMKVIAAPVVCRKANRSAPVAPGVMIPAGPSGLIAIN